MQVFMVAEKPALAESIANVLSNRGCNTRRGSNGACKVHEWRGSFRDRPCQFRMTSVCGHVMGIDFTPKYNNWYQVDPAELYSATILKKEANPKLRMPQFLHNEGFRADYTVLWLDCDLEGENICFEVLDCIGALKTDGNPQDNVYRAKFSSITDVDIRNAFSKLSFPNLNESKSVDVRQELDLRIGCSFTRYQTIFFKEKYDGLDSSCISYGPCQTPSLAFCVHRYDEIQMFVPESYWNVCIECDINSKRVRLNYTQCPLYDLEVANVIQSQVKKCDIAVIDSVEKETKRKVRPLPLNTVEMLRAASSGLGMSPADTMHAAERLYTGGMISYPRTETTSYAKNFDLKQPLKMFAGHPAYSRFASVLLQNGIQQPRRGVDHGDHPPITPVGPPRGDLSEGGGSRLYDYIVRHFIATLSGDYIYDETKVQASCAGHKFQTTFQIEIEPGWTALLRYGRNADDDDEVQTTMDVRVGQQLRLLKVDVKAGQTSPPELLTESDLISKMEHHGVGTDASIPVHIKNICDRGYVTVEGQKRRLRPTTLGITLIHGYEKIDPELCGPEMRSAVEKELRLVAKGQARFQDVLRHVLGIFEQKFHYYVQNITGMNILFQDSFTPLTDAGRLFSRCGKCRRFMRLTGVSTQKGSSPRLFCSNCQETYTTPSWPGRSCQLKTYREEKCPLDNFELVVSACEDGQAKVLCPNCFENPPYASMADKGKHRAGATCDTCRHPTCPFSRNATGIGACLDCDYGLLVLDDSQKPRLRIACNICQLQLKLSKLVISALALKSRCKDCDAYMVDVKYQKPTIGKEDNEDQQQCVDGPTCILCDVAFRSTVKGALSNCWSGGNRGAGRARQARSGRGTAGYGDREREGLGGRSTRDGFGGRTTREGFGGRSTHEGFGGQTTREGFGGRSTREGFGGRSTREGFGGRTTREGFVGRSTREGFGGRSTREGFVGRTTREGFGGRTTHEGFGGRTGEGSRGRSRQGGRGRSNRN